MIGVAVVCAETDEQRPLAGRLRRAVVPAAALRPARRCCPRPRRRPPTAYTALERAVRRGPPGHPDRRRAPRPSQRGLADLVDAAQADELMITTMVHDPADRLSSFERVAALARASSGAPASR